MIEIELKNEQQLDHQGGLCACGEIAVRIVKVGEVQNYYGTDYDICASESCLERAMDEEIDNLEFIRSHRHELMAEERWNLRQGK